MVLFTDWYGVFHLVNVFVSAFVLAFGTGM